jgi:dolichyl-phosphate beta-glucosyltransferase
MQPTPCPTLSVIIPAYDESRRIGETLERVIEYLDRAWAAYELIVVDDGSRDDTAALVARYADGNPGVRLIRFAENRGKGAAVRAGVLQSRGELVLFSDADLSTPIEELEPMIAAVHRGADVVIGSRAVTVTGTSCRRPLHRELISRGFGLLVRCLGGRAVAAFGDTQCGFKLFRGPVARALFAASVIDGFAFDVEILVLCHRSFRVAEVPVRWAHADGSQVSLLRDSAAMLRDLVRIRRLHRRRGRALPRALGAATQGQPTP